MCLTKYGKKTMFTAKTTSDEIEFPRQHIQRTVVTG